MRGLVPDLNQEEGVVQDPFGPPPGAGKDPFGAQNRTQGFAPVWLRTRAGIEFMDIFIGEDNDGRQQHRLVFLHRVMDNDLYNVGLCTSKTTESGEWKFEGLPHGEARGHAVVLARDLSVDGGGNAAWRQDPPSTGQLNLIERLGLDHDEIQNKGDASDVLNVHFASKVLDPVFGF